MKPWLFYILIGIICLVVLWQLIKWEPQITIGTIGALGGFAIFYFLLDNLYGKEYGA